MSASLLPVGFRDPHDLCGLLPDTPVLVGFSGGADSLALLHMLNTLRAKKTFPLYALHVHHGIRGAEADGDEAFCRRTAETLGVPFFSVRADVPALSRAWHLGIEESARRVRYEAFATCMKEQGIPLLVTAHHADDNLETMLFHMVRGSGLAGLCGIPETRRLEEGYLCRPLLSVSRAEILAYCEANDLSYVSDSTNVNEDYTRNRMREHVIPALCRIHPGAVKNAARLAETLRSDNLCLQSMADWFLEELEEDASLALDKIAGAPDAVVNRALLTLFTHVSGGGRLEWIHLRELRLLCQKGVPHSSLSLPCRTRGVIENGRLCFLPEAEARPALVEDYCTPLSEGRNHLSQTSVEILMESSQKAKNIYKNSILLILDSAKIKGTLRARSRRPGDRIRLGGIHRSLKKIYCDRKISPTLRRRLPVLCDDDGIVAVPSIGIKDGLTAKPGTPDSLYVTVTFIAEEPDEKK